ncbi:unnamed protein product, partial [Mesorhabditis belari]|uniref:Piwi domain-containing protein n=1 Tax=Mesorhabditis belari TaxID=2138241 RepID=A0AAF3F3V7_9BILA
MCENFHSFEESSSKLLTTLPADLFNQAMSNNNPIFSLVQKLAPGTAGQLTQGIVVNGFPIRLEKNLPIFKYDLRILVYFPRAAKPREVTKQNREDFTEVNRKLIQAELMSILVARESTFFPEGQASFVTDSAACCYSLNQFSIEDLENGVTFTLDAEELADVSGISNPVKAEIILKPAKEFQSSSNNLDNFFKEFANVAVSHEAYQHNEKFVVANSDVLFIDPQAGGFNRDDAPDLPGAAKAIPTLKKSVKVVEGPPVQGQKPKLMIMVDLSKHPMHLEVSLEEKIKATYMEHGGRSAPRSFNMQNALKAQHVLNQLKNLEVQPIHRSNAPSFTIKGFGAPANVQVIHHGGPTVQAFFKTQYGKNLKNPTWNVVRDFRGSFFPIEVLKVCPYQKVKKSQEFAEQGESTTKSASTLPARRKPQIITALRALNINNDNFMQAAGFRLTNELMYKLSTARLLNPPRIVFAQGQGEHVTNGKWRLNKNHFFAAAKVPKWELWANVEDRNLDTVGKFVTQMITRGRNRGVQLGVPKKLHIDANDMDQYMADAKKNGTQFVLVVSEEYEERHKELKYLEIKYNIPTQEVTMRVCRNAVEKNQGVTFDNIIMKTNIKNRGLCHDIHFQNQDIQHLVSHPDRVIIGIEMSHAFAGTGERSASILGWSANCLQHPTVYTGNFMFVQARDAEPDLSPVFKQIFGRLQKYRKPPKFFDIFIGGVSEGQLARVAKNAVSRLMEVCRTVKVTAEISLVAVSLDHVERFFLEKPDPNGRCGEQNVSPGLVVDREVVSTMRSEFYLTACQPLQGTVKVPKYTVCVDTTNKRTMDQYQAQAYGLCHLHQYNTATTSIPTPLYVARDYAQRGADVFPFIVQRDLADGQWSLDHLNQVTYQRTPLDDVRLA